MGISLCGQGEMEIILLAQRLMGNEVFDHVKRFAGNSGSAH